jgi:hypothetical protein
MCVRCFSCSVRDPKLRKKLTKMGKLWARIIFKYRACDIDFLSISISTVELFRRTEMKDCALYLDYSKGLR